MDEESLALLGMISGDRVLAPTGKNMLEMQTAREKRARRRHIGSGFFEDEFGNIEQDPKMAAELEAREDRRDARWAERNATIFGQRTQQPQRQAVPSEGGYDIIELNPNAPGGAGTQDHVPVQRPISPDDRQKAAEAGRLMGEAEELRKLFADTPGAISAAKDTTIETLGKLPVVGGPARQLTQEQLYSRDQNKLRSRGFRFEQNLSNLAAGLALTGYEIEQRNKWSPFAAGISQEQSGDRLTNIREDFGNKVKAILGANEPFKAERVYPHGSPEDAAAREKEAKTGPDFYYVPGKGLLDAKDR